MSDLHRLDNVIRSYDWGSRTVLAELFGRPVPSDGPEAELWIGAHPGAPSRLAGGGTLLDLIGADPAGTLGPGRDRLPFLLKILAVERPLSIQVHPDAAQAAAGYARENEAGIPAGDAKRSYHDDWPKPELVCALTPFTALCGFRPVEEAAALLEGLAGERTGRIAAVLRAEGPRGAVTLLADWPEADRRALVAEVVTGSAGTGGLACSWARRIAEQYPADPGVVTSLLLNLVVLQPGEAMFARPRTIHAYLHGTAVEIMAGSDNVLRGGLTPKHIDLPELLAITRFEPSPPDLVAASALQDGEDLYPAPVRQFRLTRLSPDPVLTVDVPGPGAVLCLEGSLEVSRGDSVERLTPGEAVFVPFAGGPLRVTGPGTGFRASVPA
ncbi:mannose-6-phosphate isomerase, class I [Actinocorallia longicatena]|uniref:mannose-6-phosphate isomerase n=1 Tax=Actinocorallia longicatena TaxID=111803 RepID=A0ABP6QLP9_9ACTN